MKLARIAIVVWAFTCTLQAQVIDLEIGTGTSIDLDTVVIRDTTSDVVRLRIPNTPQAVLDTVFYDDLGRKLRTHFLLDKENELVLGTHRRGIKIELIHGVNSGYIIIARDKRGRIIDIKEEDLYLTDLGHGKVCYSLVDPVDVDVPTYIGVAIDISGSMKKHLGDVSQSFSQFLNAIPSQSQCQVSLFDNRTLFVSPDNFALSLSSHRFSSCKKFSRLGLTSYGGGTKIIPPVEHMYEALTPNKDAHNLLLVLTDGRGEDDGRSQIKRLLEVKDKAENEAGVYTIINWLGDYNKRSPISKIGDHSVIGFSGKAAGQAFFKASQTFIKKRKFLEPQECKAP